MTSPSAGPRPGLATVLVLYTLARIALLALVTGLLLLAGVPLAIAVLVGLIVALPLSMVLFRGLRDRLDATLAESRRRRSAERAALRRRLRGEAPGSDETFAEHPAQGQGEPGQG